MVSVDLILKVSLDINMASIDKKYVMFELSKYDYHKND